MYTSKANQFHSAANKIAERFAAGQPILVGHHSERKARRDQQKMRNEMDAAVKAQKAVSYWNYKAEGVERHANRKNNVGVRVRRIKTLLADLRDRQRDINHAHICIDLWEKIDSITDREKRNKNIEFYSGAQLKTGSAAPWLQNASLYSLLQDKKISHEEVIKRCLDFHDHQSKSPNTLRWISHILNRLAFERSELGEIQRYDGELTAVILQAFAREQGAHSPKATQDANHWRLSSPVALPLHLSEDCEIELNSDEWRDLMQATGYEVPTPKPRKQSTHARVPLINLSIEEATTLQNHWNQTAQKEKGHLVLGGIKFNEVKPVTQAYFSTNNIGSYSVFKTIELDVNGFKIHPKWDGYKGKSGEPVCRIRVYNGGGSLYAPDSIVCITDKPTKPLPIDLNLDISEEVEKAAV